MKKIREPVMDRTAFSIGNLSDNAEEIKYWQERTPAEHLAAMEQIRQIIYGYDPSTTRLQRVLEVIERE